MNRTPYPDGVWAMRSNRLLGDCASRTVAGREPSQSSLSRPFGRPSTIALRVAVLGRIEDAERRVADRRRARLSTFAIAIAGGLLVGLAPFALMLLAMEVL